MMEVDQQAQHVDDVILMTPLGNLFWQNPTASSIKDLRVQYTLAKYLGTSELKGLRCQNKFCANWVTKCPYFRKSGRISDSWYKQTAGCITDTPILWSKFHITHFSFRRTSIDFPVYLLKTGMNIKELKLSHSTLGTLALSFILNSCRNMESLTLDAVRFRDVDHVSDYDNPLLLENALPISETDDTAHLEEALRIRKAFRHLYVYNTFIMEDISAVQLMDRSQYLQSISLVKCLKDETNSYNSAKSMNRGITFHQRCVSFMVCITDILTANRQSLTRLVIDDCNIHEDVLEILATIFQNLTLKDLSLTITLSNISPPEVILTKLFTPQCNWSILEQFSLDFHGNISGFHIKNILEKTVNTLKVFKLITHTNDLSKDICLKSELSKMKVLQSLYIKDAKEIAEKDMKESRQLHSKRQKQLKNKGKSFVCNHSDLLQSGPPRYKIESDFCTDFLLSLPSTITGLSLCGIIRDQNFHEKLCQIENITEKFLNLTSLEIRGPHLSIYDFSLGKFILQMTNLNSLTLSDCDLTDSHLTGLSEESARTIRKCGTYMLALNNCMDACNNTEGTAKFQDADILKTFSIPGSPGLKLENGFRFAKMTDLKHLDLSFNPGISDVTIFYSLQIPHLESLSLESCPKITDSGLEFMPSHLKNVEEINLRNCRRLSKHGLNKLVRFCPKIKRILTTKVIQNNDFSIDVHQLSSSFNAVAIPENFNTACTNIQTTAFLGKMLSQLPSLLHSS